MSSSPLHQAAEFAFPEACQRFLAAGEHIDALDGLDRTPLACLLQTHAMHTNQGVIHSSDALREETAARILQTYHLLRNHGADLGLAMASLMPHDQATRYWVAEQEAWRLAASLDLQTDEAQRKGRASRL